MKIKLGVCEFGKIKNAEVDITNFTIFVGNNNSGKTYMMQLIYGVLEELSNVHLTLGEWSSDLPRMLGEKEFQLYEEKATEYLRTNKEKIILKIFHKNIPIKDLYIKLYDITETATISYEIKKVPFETELENMDSIESNEEKTDKLYSTKNFIIAHITIKDGDKILSGNTISFDDSVSYKAVDKICISQVIGNLIGISRNFGREHTIYFPASRTGLLLLYKSFFVEKDEHKLVFSKEGYGNEFGLSQPVYDFLKFLMKYNSSEFFVGRNKKLIKFVEEHLIEGTISQKEDEDIYFPENSGIPIPLYLASSMVNELTPILRMLMGRTQYKTILYDEIETCLHPSKQTEMARLLIRLNNEGMRLIVSTHSDTMATKLNNLLLLSMAELSKEEKEKKLEKLHLEKDDLLRKGEIHIYQFENQADGSSIVKELDFIKVPYIGFDFSQFINNAQDLYDESLVISE